MASKSNSTAGGGRDKGDSVPWTTPMKLGMHNTSTEEMRLRNPEDRSVDSWCHEVSEKNAAL